MNPIIVADFSNFGNFGGAEKNAELITFDLEKKLNKRIIKVSKRKNILFLFLKSLFKIQKVSYFICYKNSSITGLFFKITGSKLIIRFNNSPEAYLYWLKVSSIVSHLLKLKLIKSEIIIFNSEKIKNYYKLFARNNNQLYFLPNNFKNDPISIKAGRGNKIYLASRLSWEKNLVNAYRIINLISKDIGYEAKAYTSTKNCHQELLNFGNIDYFFNDIYVSLSFFEGMPNMVYHALFKGSALFLSNCWSHIEIYNLLTDFGLENRVYISSFNNKDNLRKGLNELKKRIDSDKQESVKEKLVNLRNFLLREYEMNLTKLSETIK